MRLARLASLLLVAACQQKAPPPPPPPTEVIVIEATARTLDQPVEFVGTVEASRRVEVRAQVAGVILARPYTEGAAVQPGRPVTPPDSIPSGLLERRPDVMRSLHEWSGAAARVGVAVANRLPAFTITGSYGRQQPSFDHLFGGAGEIYTAQAGVSIPLFTGGRLASEQRAAEARADQARIRYEQTLLTALQEASDGLSNVRLSRDGLAAAAARAGALRRGLTLAEERYRAGVSSYLEVLDAERTLFDAELALVQARRQYLAAVVQLYKALGGWWQ